MKSILPILILGLLMMVLLPQGEGAPMDSVLRSKRSPQDAEEGDVEATTPVWCNPSNPFRSRVRVDAKCKELLGARK